MCVVGEEGVVGINRINKARTRGWGNQMAGKRFGSGGNRSKAGFALGRQGINEQGWEG